MKEKIAEAIAQLFAVLLIFLVFLAIDHFFFGNKGLEWMILFILLWYLLFKGLFENLLFVHPERLIGLVLLAVLFFWFKVRKREPEIDIHSAREGLTVEQKLMVESEFEKRKKSKLITYLLLFSLGGLGRIAFMSVIS